MSASGRKKKKPKSPCTTPTVERILWKQACDHVVKESSKTQNNMVRLDK